MNIKIIQPGWVIFLFSLLVIAGCEKVAFEPVEISNDSVSFSLGIQPILSDNCVKCHPPTKDLDLNPASSYASLVPEFVTPSDSANPEASKLYLKLTGSSHSPRTSDIEKQIILKWISQGVPDN